MNKPKEYSSFLKRRLIYLSPVGSLDTKHYHIDRKTIFLAYPREINSLRISIRFSFPFFMTYCLQWQVE